MVEAPKHTRLGDGPIQQDYREKMSAVMAALDRFMNGEAKAPPLSRWILTRTHLPSNWHIDPPYNNEAGSRYPNSDLTYSSLAAWCRGLPGHVDVCENVGADWLPFSPLYEVVTSRGRRSGVVSREAVWRNTQPEQHEGTV